MTVRAPLPVMMLLGVAMASPGAAQTALFDIDYAGANIRVPIESYRDRQFARVIRQQYDFSCGSAALATLLTHHYQIEKTETDLFIAMWEAGEKELIKKRGFSLLDMKRYLERGGIAADGFKVPFDKLNELRLPGIALINVNGYRHFVVIKGVRDDRVLIGDPSLGLIVRSRKDFLASWDGTMLFLRNYVAYGRATWNDEADWQAHPAGRPDDALFARDLAAETLHYTRFPNSGFAVGLGF